jgi:hypothetical protein
MIGAALAAIGAAVLAGVGGTHVPAVSPLKDARCNAAVTELHSEQVIFWQEVGAGYATCGSDTFFESQLCMEMKAKAGNWVGEGCSRLDVHRASGTIHNRHIVICKHGKGPREWRDQEHVIVNGINESSSDFRTGWHYAWGCEQ